MIDSVIIGYDKSSGDIPVLTVGRVNSIDRSVSIVNAFRGDEAVELYNRLTTVKKSEGVSNE